MGLKIETSTHRLSLTRAAMLARTSCTDADSKIGGHWEPTAPDPMPTPARSNAALCDGSCWR